MAYSSNIERELLRHHGSVTVESRRMIQHMIQYAHVNLKMVV